MEKEYVVLRGYLNRLDAACRFAVHADEKEIQFREEYEYYERDDDPGMEYIYTAHISISSLDVLLQLLMKQCQLELPTPELFEEKISLLQKRSTQLAADGQFKEPGSVQANLDLLQRWLKEEGIPCKRSQWAF